MSRALIENPSAAAPPVSAGKKADPRIEYARPQAAKFFLLAVQLALLTLVMHLYRVGEFKGPDLSFTYLFDAAFVLFAIHYWVPFGLKEPFWVTASLCATFIWLEWQTAVLLLAAGGIFFAVVRSALSYRIRLALIAAAFGVGSLMAANKEAAQRLLQSLTSFGIPASFWPAFGSIFVLRMIVYMHDLRYMKEKPGLQPFLAYFFILPNYVMPLMPVIDYATMRASYYRRDGHRIAQQGIHWMTRGVIQLGFYRIVHHLRDVQNTVGIDSFAAVVSFMVLTFLLYTRVSGQFHLAIGMLHLFGYDLPETYRKYLLSSSLADWWRRANIYWKDFMVKLVYFPVFFRLRKSGQLRAKLAGTVAVFLVTWALHSYQYLWIRGTLLFHPVDVAFWTIFGLLMTANIWWEHKQEVSGKRPAPTRLGTALSTVATMSVIIVLWSLWDSPTFEDWFDMLAWWR